ncbi:MAG: PRC-barrel domain-containing protein [Hyphomicrobiaceae bacterium]
MIRTFALAVGMSALLLQAAPASAQEIPAGVFYTEQTPTYYLARDLLLSAKVYGANDKIIGDIEDLILNEDNQIVGVIMGVGGFLGLGEKRIGVRYRALTFSTEGDRVKVSLPEATPEVLKLVPAYERARPAKSLLDRAIERARELADKTAETSRDALEKAKESAGPALERAREAAGQAYEKAKDAASQAYEKAKEAAQPAQRN